MSITKTSIKLGINMGFATNRFPEPEVWTKIVGKDLGLRYVQFVADLLNPWLPDNLMKAEVNKIKKNCKKYNVRVDTTFPAAFTRVNHVLHPDPEMRKLWMGYFKRFFSVSAELGARGSGCGPFGIYSVTDYNNKKRRDYLLKEGIESWHKLADHGKKIGFKFLIFEPMSIPRECANTIEETWKLYKKLNEGSSLPILLCLDVDHGDLESKNPDDTDAYAWIREFAPISPIIHIKQSTMNKGGHWPFTAQYNKEGKIIPSKVIKAIEDTGAKDVILTFEFSFRERYPAEYGITKKLKESVQYWRKYIKK